MESEERYLKACEHALQQGRIKAVMYRRGAVVTGWPSRWPDFGSKPKPKRGIIRSQSDRSIIRAGFMISNTPADFELMTTLTFRVSHPDPKGCLRAWCKAMQLGVPSKEPWAWVMEFQERGIVHFHVLHTLEALFVRFGTTDIAFNTIVRRGRKRTIVDGVIRELMAKLWIDQVKDTSPEFRRFQLGGTTELLEQPDKAGMYLGKEVGKWVQKTLPEGQEALGRWWWLSPSARPVAGVEQLLHTWPFKRAHRLVHDHRRIHNHLDSSEITEK